LSGVVVVKKTGQPVEGAKVVVCHSQQAHLYFGEPGELEAYGPDQFEPVTWFLSFLGRSARKTAASAETDETGHFTFSRLATPGELYHLAVSDAEYGCTLLLNLKPEDYFDRELRVELEEPGFIRTDYFDPSPRPGLRCYSRLRLVGPAEATEVAAGESELNVWGWPSEEEVDPGDRGGVGLDDLRAVRSADLPRFLRYGPLPGGLRYRLSLVAAFDEMSYSATIFERLVTVEPGKTVEALMRSPAGATISGRISDVDGNPLRYVNVTVKVAPPAELVLGAITDAEGRYQIKGVLAGQHKLELLRHAKRTGPG